VLKKIKNLFQIYFYFMRGFAIYMFGTTQPKKQYEQVPDVLHSIYQHIDFKKASIGGSYALSQLTGDPSWSPNDVDIVTSHMSMEEFRASVELFCQKTGAILVKFNDFANGHPDMTPGEARREEKFHEAIKGSARVTLDGVPLDIQFVLIHSNLCGDASVEFQLNETSDLPSCVSYKVERGRKFFTIPEKGREALFTKMINKQDICPARLDKYKNRGYEFY
jgi:hypothetical protein